MGANFGPRNHNWRGGRSVASNGYVLVRVGVGQPEADCRGYAYEHRLVARRMLGRPLRKGEQVHHRDHDKTNNSPENLLVVGSFAEHRIHHRTKDVGLRLPNEPNPEISCRCGCGTKLLKFDSSGRPREYVSGHNPRLMETQDAILSFLATGTKTRFELILLTGRTKFAVAVALTKLTKKGAAVRIARATYRLCSEEGQNG